MNCTDYLLTVCSLWQLCSCSYRIDGSSSEPIHKFPQTWRRRNMELSYPTKHYPFVKHVYSQVCSLWYHDEGKMYMLQQHFVVIKHGIEVSKEVIMFRILWGVPEECAISISLDISRFKLFSDKKEKKKKGHVML